MPGLMGLFLAKTLPGNREKIPLEKIIFSLTFANWRKSCMRCFALQLESHILPVSFNSIKSLSDNKQVCNKNLVGTYMLLLDQYTQIDLFHNNRENQTCPQICAIINLSLVYSSTVL